jgi:membrane-bound serine protease (ClpP class)
MIDGTLTFAVFLFLACAALLVAEVFVPSGGLLTVGAVACVAGGITLFFQHSAMVGWFGVGVAVVLIPTVLIVTYRILPRTRFGRAVTLTPPNRIKGDAVPEAEQHKALLGEQGTVKSPLHPVGVCDFSGRRVECVAETGYVDTGAMVRVIRVEGSQITVRVIERT